ncbi:MAG: hypothetical protein MZV49_10830 [Rhodopseudomonas palustris]|nr:hypothetical protein [Rhodopseudomonas palustris]
MREVWREVLADVEDRIRSVMVDSIATWDKALLLLLNRNGYLEETYHLLLQPAARRHWRDRRPDVRGHRRDRARDQRTTAQYAACARR